MTHDRTPHIAAFVVDDPDRRFLARRPRGCIVHFSSTLEQVVEDSCKSNAYGALIELRAEQRGAIFAAIRALDIASIPVALRCQLDDNSTAALTRIAALSPNLAVSLRDEESLDIAVAHLMASVEPVPSSPMMAIAALHRALRPSAATVVVGALLLGKSLSSVESLARACRCGPHSLRTLCREESLPQPHLLLGWSSALNVLWQMEHAGLTEKAVAAQMGYSSPRALGNSLQQICGSRPRALLRNGGHAAALARFIALLPLIPDRIACPSTHRRGERWPEESGQVG